MYICPKNNDEVISNKNEFISILRNDVHRRGRENFIAWLERTDFFTAPASTRFHEAYPGGLCEHSLVVRQKLVALNEAAPTEYKLTDEQVTLVALGHDVCKTNFYKASTRNVKNETTGQWEKVPCYTVQDQYPYGHGEKSVDVLRNFFELDDVEKIAIRCHMGGFDDSVKGGAYFIGNAFEMYPAALSLHLADMQATYQKETH